MTTLEDIQYLVNAVGNRTQMTNSAGATTWTYDAIDRLTKGGDDRGRSADAGWRAAGAA